MVDKENSNKYDNNYLDEILSNNMIKKIYIKCILGEDKCTSGGEKIKKIVIDMITKSDKDNTNKQKEDAKKIFDNIVENDKENLEKLLKKYDPNRIFYKEYRK